MACDPVLKQASSVSKAKLGGRSLSVILFFCASVNVANVPSWITLFCHTTESIERQ